MNRNDEYASPFTVCAPTAHPLVRWLGGLAERTLALRQLQTIYQTVPSNPSLPAFIDGLLDAGNIQPTVSADDLARIPASGPVVVVANHPFGGVEGLVLASLLLRARPDVRIMANYLLSHLPELRDLFLFVDPFETRQAARANIRGLREALACLNTGQMLGVFPAGEVAHLNMRTRQVVDPPWNPNVARLIRRTGAAVLPVYFHGQNSPLFQLAGMVHPRLRTALLPRELLQRRNSTIAVQIGSVIPHSHLHAFATDHELIEYLRHRTYVLSSRTAHKTISLPRLSARPQPEQQRRLAPVIGALDPALLAAEVASLPAAQCLTTSGDYAVYQASATQIPHLLTEIGRLREIAFRGTGEGTGAALDLDAFDRSYLHLFVWNQATHEVVGAYRLGLSDVLVQRYGLKGLYTNTLFRYSPRFIERISPAIELGRSFVRPEYQRSYAPLLLLWRGIGQFVMENPQYRMVFGPVSISSTYKSMSRKLMVTFLQLQHSTSDLARLVKPRNPPVWRGGTPYNPEHLSRMTRGIEHLSDIIQDIETDEKGVSVLIRQYIKLGAKVLGFNVDPDFRNALDALMVVDLTRTDYKVLQRYVGKPQADAFLAYHHQQQEKIA